MLIKYVKKLSLILLCCVLTYYMINVIMYASFTVCNHWSNIQDKTQCEYLKNNLFQEP